MTYKDIMWDNLSRSIFDVDFIYRCIKSTKTAFDYVNNVSDFVLEFW